MKTLRASMLFIYLGIIFWIIYNCYFGWNDTAQTVMERLCDQLFSIFMLVGVILYFQPLHGMYVRKLKNVRND